MSINNKNLQDTADSDPILSDSFLVNGVFSDLYFYPNEFRVVQKNSVKTISIDFDLTFSIIKNGDEHIGLELIKQNERIQFTRDFWSRAQEWENILLCYMTRKDFHQSFKPLKKIGRGNFATVYLAEDIHRNRDVAIKAFMKEKAYLDNGKKAIQNQIKVLRRIKSDHIVKLYGVYSTPNSLYLSMQHINGVSLQAYLKKSEKMHIYQRKKFLTSLLIALKDLKSLRVVHRDIKPDNILVSYNLATVKLVDFGLATSIDEPTYIFIRCGTPGYVAPEILRIRDLQNVRLGYQSDMFSLGAIYYQILYGKPLFPGKDQTEVLQSNRMCRIRCQQIEHGAYGQVQLLTSMLQIDPNKRITPQQALQSEFLREKRSLTDRRKILAPLSLKNEEPQYTDFQ